MADLFINRANVGAQNIKRVKPGQEVPAQEAAKKDGLDNVFIKVERDTYVASGKGMDLKRVKPGSPAVVNGIQGTVTMVDNQLNSAFDGIRETGKALKYGLAAGETLGAGLLTYQIGVEASAVGMAGAMGMLMAIPNVAMMGAIAGAVAGGVGLAGTVLYGAVRQGDSHALDAFTE